MLEVKGIDNGIVLDHITAGNGIKVFNKLFSEQTDYPVVLVMNVESGILGRKDIIKIENKFDVDLDALGLIDENITVNIIRDGKRVDKQKVSIPEKVSGLFECKNPRCITNHDSYCEPTFDLVSRNGEVEYACSFCEEITKFKL